MTSYSLDNMDHCECCVNLKVDVDGHFNVTLETGNGCLLKGDSECRGK